MKFKILIFTIVSALFFQSASAEQRYQISPETRESIERFSLDLEQQAYLFSGKARELVELLRRDADLVNEQASDWVSTFSEQLILESEKLLEKSLQQLPEHRSRDREGTPRQIAI